MSSWVSFAKSFIEGENKNFANLPRMTQDMIRTHAQLRDYKEFNQLQSPMLQVTGGTPYSPQDVMEGIRELLSHDIHSFVVVESSTYLSKLLQDLIDISDNTAFPASCSISSTMHKSITTRWGDVRQINGLVVKITYKSSRKALPSDVIQ